ncbi:DNA helicase MCM8-like [Sycon ciliatum]|uniref:DNA helicase MCM8-like n=1 Tax=Sycon ciliatum TaxID=27933 RepID=UPI0031F6D2DA
MQGRRGGFVARGASTGAGGTDSGPARGGGGGRWNRGSWRGGWRGRGRGQGGGYARGGYGRGGSTQSATGANAYAEGSIVSSQSQARRVQTTLVNCPYAGWSLYFPTDAFSPTSLAGKRSAVFAEYFRKLARTWTPETREAIELQGSIGVDFTTLQDDPSLNQKLPDFLSDLKEQPSPVLAAMGVAVHQVLVEAQAAAAAATASGSPPAGVPQIAVRILHFEPLTPLKILKAPQYGKFVSVRGTVVRVGNVKPLVTRLTFQCNSCAAEQTLVLPDGKYMQPSQCPGDGCRAKVFNPLRSSPQTQTTDWQSIKLQECNDLGEEQREAGRIPRTVEVELTSDMVDSCVPGDVVTVAAIVKASGTDEARGRFNKDKCTFLIYLEANSISNSKATAGSNGGSNSAGTGDNATDPASANGPHVQFSAKDLYAIQKIQEEDHLFRLIINSLCPSIYGHELVKAGLALGLFGGTRRFLGEKNRIPVRGDPHVLVVGDPGLGKSQMLQAVANIAPRGVYVCGNTTTTSGLTVTLSRDGGTGDYALEAGALVLADQGCCCIDEFDKMGNQHQALLEAMEQQSISIAKAGIVCSLPARASILAAANPVGGHYNKAKTVSENLKMGSALLSRFDLVFILLDKPDEELDWMLSEHVMALHAGQRRVAGTPRMIRRGAGPETPGGIATSGDDSSYAQWQADKPLSERLKLPSNEIFDPIPPALLRKYVAYASKYVQPRLSKEAADVLQKFYLGLRKNHDSMDSTPITARQLESLIRLSEARARIELCEEVSASHAEDVVQIMNHSMMDVYTDGVGAVDCLRSQSGSGMSKTAQGKRLASQLQRVSEQTYNALFSVQQIKTIAQEIGVDMRLVDDLIASLNNQGFLLKKGPRVYQLQIAS